MSVSAPYDRGPAKSGFDRFYGFIGGESNQWAPTVLEAAKLPQPKSVNDVTQRAMDGVSMAYALDDARAADRRTTQHFEIFGNCAIYHQGWVAATRHSIPWLLAENPTLADDVWELDNVDEAKPRTGANAFTGKIIRVTVERK